MCGRLNCTRGTDEEFLKMFSTNVKSAVLASDNRLKNLSNLYLVRQLRSFSYQKLDRFLENALGPTSMDGNFHFMDIPINSKELAKRNPANYRNLGHDPYLTWNVTAGFIDILIEKIVTKTSRSQGSAADLISQKFFYLAFLHDLIERQFERFLLNYFIDESGYAGEFFFLFGKKCRTCHKQVTFDEFKQRIDSNTDSLFPLCKKCCMATMST